MGVPLPLTGPLAQLVEQRAFNPWVLGSIPRGFTIFSWVDSMKTITLTVKLKLHESSQYLNKDELRVVVENMDYSFDHPMIKDTEIYEDDI